ncbi:tight adherence protein B [Brevibacterium pityocampae]
MTLPVLIPLIFAVIVVAAAGFVVFALGSGEQADFIRAERGRRAVGFRERVIRPLNTTFVRTRLGGRLSTALIQANLRRIYPVEYLGAAVLTGLLVIVLLTGTLAPFWAIVLTATVLWGFWAALNFLREREREKFLAQLPEFARIMANSTGAGLSIHSALQVAASELPDPAGRELRGLERELAIGTPLDVGLERMAERIKGRDLDVLVSTLVIAQRAGGSLISALRQMSTTLEERKEAKREVKTLVTQSSYTGYMVIAFGVGFVLLMNAMNPGILYKLTDTVIGQIGIIVAGISYVLGLFLIRKLTQVKI